MQFLVDIGFIFVILPFVIWVIVERRTIKRLSNSLNNGDFDTALKAANRSFWLSINRAQAYYNRGVVYMHKGEPAPAIADFSEAIRRNPRNAQAFFSRAFVHYRMGGLDQAIEDVNSSIAIDPENVPNYLVRASLYVKQQRFDDALADTAYALALCQAELEQAEKFGAYISREDIKPEINKRIAAVYCQCGHTYVNMKDHIKAFESFNRALEFNADDPLVLFNYAEGLTSLKHHQHVLDMLERMRIYEEKKEPIRLFSLMGEFAMKQVVDMLEAVNRFAVGDTETAIMLWQAIVEKDPRLHDAGWAELYFNWPLGIKELAVPLIEAVQIAAQADSRPTMDSSSP